MKSAYKYRIYPNKSQEILLAKSFGCCRFVYNYAIDISNKYYESTKKTLSAFEIDTKITELKKQKDFEWLSEVPSQSLQQSVHHFGDSRKRFFKKSAGFPKFKNKYSNQSISFPQGVKIDFDKNSLILPKLKTMKVKFHRCFDTSTSKIGTCIVTRTKSNEYYISVLVEDNLKQPDKIAFNQDNIVGIDLGIKDYVILSDQKPVPETRNLDNSKRALVRMKALQAQLAKKQKQSINRKKLRLKIAKLFQYITNIRKDFEHKLSHYLVNNYDGIIFETLSIQNMMQEGNSSLARNIANSSWYRFQTYCEYKANRSGKYFHKIGRFVPSTKKCSQCGYVMPEIELSIREWDCLSCNSHHDRDENAAKNIRNVGLIDMRALYEIGKEHPELLMEGSEAKPHFPNEEALSFR